MIIDIIKGIEIQLKHALSFLGCIFQSCAPSTAWRWFPEKVNLFDILTVSGAFGSLVAIFFAAAAIYQSSKARNLSTIVEITRQIYAERQRAQDLKLFQMDDVEFHAFQMIHLVEQASMIINSRMVSGKSREFLRDWLKVELPEMAKQAAYKDAFSITTGPQLEEMRKLYTEICAELRQERLYEEIYARKKSKQAR